MWKQKNTRLGIIGTVGVPSRYGGFETLVHYLVPNLKGQFDIIVYCSAKSYAPKERRKSWKGARLRYIPLNANGFQSIIYDIWSMLHAVFHCDVLLVLGVSGCLFLPFIKLFSNKKVIVNIDGLEWRRPKWNRFAKKFLLWSEGFACRFADEIITDNLMLQEYVKIRYGRKSNLIEYGADHVGQVAIQSEELIEKYPFLSGKYGFKVARIEPENHLHLILEAFAFQTQHTLVIVGNWKNSAYGKKLRKQYRHYEHIYLLDPIYELDQLNLLRSNAYFYVHGHSAGGTNPSLVEAMYLALPIITFDVIYNRVTTNNQAIYFSTASDLKAIIDHIENYSLGEIAANLKAYANLHYTWPYISECYGRLLKGLVVAGKPTGIPDIAIGVSREVVPTRPPLSLQLKAKAAPAPSVERTEYQNI